MLREVPLFARGYHVSQLKFELRSVLSVLLIAALCLTVFLLSDTFPSISCK